ncbi:MAG TPA: hypothetical protein VER96_20055 [Polyangiaceae bacterium]|nr:hypothetical protein [Polyangiaceae bacterium]
MRRFSAKGTALAIGPAEFLIRLVMCAFPSAILVEQGAGMAAAMAVFLGMGDGNYRLGSHTSRSLVADRRGLEITRGLNVQVVPWSDVSAIQAWQHFNRVDFVAVHYFRAGRINVATCASRYAENELRAFVHACANYVSVGAPRLSISTAGLGEPCIYRPLLKRFFQDVAAATLVGALLGVAGPSFVLGTLAALLSVAVAATRYSVRSTKLVQKDGIWWAEGHTHGRIGELRPLRAIPRALRLWVECLGEVR